MSSLFLMNPAFNFLSVLIDGSVLDKFYLWADLSSAASLITVVSAQSDSLIAQWIGVVVV